MRKIPRWLYYVAFLFVVLLLIYIRHETGTGYGSSQNLTFRGVVSRVDSVTSRRVLATVDLASSSTDHYDVRDTASTWCCVVKGNQAEILLYPYVVLVGDSIDYGPGNRVRLIRNGTEVYNQRVQTSALGGVFQKVRAVHRL